MNKNKIINDPIYGLIRIPFGMLLDIIDDPRFQRLRRIHQMGLSHLVYPGAVHTRFHHAIGAMHITWVALTTLRNKGVSISDHEALSCLIAILLHDVGHGPYSHALEGKFLPVSHEHLSLMIMEEFNRDSEGQLDTAIEIFTDQYKRPFFHQLISSQLDMDRIDYLNRDSFYTGVIEGKIGYDRIITMLNVVNEELVVEEKAVFSVEKYLSSRSFMYRQVYLHKASLASELMLSTFVDRMMTLTLQDPRHTTALNYFIGHQFESHEVPQYQEEILKQYLSLDDADILHCLKVHSLTTEDFLLETLARGLIDRKLFTVRFDKEGIEQDYISAVRSRVQEYYGCSSSDAHLLVSAGVERKKAYRTDAHEIRILTKQGQVLKYSDWERRHQWENIDLYYLCAPKFAF